MLATVKHDQHAFVAQPRCERDQRIDIGRRHAQRRPNRARQQGWVDERGQAGEPDPIGIRCAHRLGSGERHRRLAHAAWADNRQEAALGDA